MCVLHLPQLDAERGSYRLLESRLADVLLRSCGIDRSGPLARAVKNWKRPGVKGVGEFARVLQEVR